MSWKIISALIESNKLGAKGLQVVGYAEPAKASDEDKLYLVYQIPTNANADKINWFEK